MLLQPINPTDQQVKDLIETLSGLYSDGEVNMPEWAKVAVMHTIFNVTAQYAKGSIALGTAFMAVAKLSWIIQREAAARNWMVN